MALTFSNEQLKTLSKDVLQLPFIIDNPVDGTGLIQQKANVKKTKDALYATDQQNKVFSDHWGQVISNYHEELDLLKGEKRTDYAEGTLVEGGKSLPPHYTPTHPDLLPIVDTTNNGLPLVTGTSDHEIALMSRIESALNDLIQGFNSGGGDFVIDTISGSELTLISGTLNSGQHIIIDQGASSMYAVVGSAGAGTCVGGSGATESLCTIAGGVWSTPINITPISASKSFSGGARVRTFHTGFSNAERGRTSNNYAKDVQSYFESVIESEVSKWHTALTTISTISTEDTNATRKATNATYKNDVDNMLNTLDDWTIEQDTNKFTDTHIQAVSTTIATRKTDNPLRVTKIVEHLGNVADAENGTGAYNDLWKFIVLRIAKSGGTLYGWYGMELGVNHFNTKIKNATTQLDEYTSIFEVKKLTENYSIGGNEVTVENTTNLSQNDTIKIFDDNSPVLDATIISMDGLVLTLNQGLSSDISMASLGRIVKNV